MLGDKPVRGAGFPLFCLLQIALFVAAGPVHSTVAVEVAADDASTCASPSGNAKQAALVQKDSRLAPSRETSLVAKKDDTAAAGGVLSKAEQAIARRERALLRAQQARKVAQQARERRLRLEAERASRLKARSHAKTTMLREDNLFSEDGADAAEHWQHEMIKRRRAKNSRHDKHKKQDDSSVSPMVTMVLFLMSVPTGIVVASLGVVLFVSRLRSGGNGSNLRDASARRTVWRSKPAANAASSAI